MQASNSSCEARLPNARHRRLTLNVVFVKNNRNSLCQEDMDGIKKALELMAKGQDKNGKDCPGYREHWDWFMNENEDASTGDLFVQLALFGKEEYC